MKTNKELKAEYKQMKFPMGVFQIRNIVNGKILIDSSTNMNSKWNRHQAQLKFGNNLNTELQNDWNKYSEENFVFEVLSELEEDGGNENYKKELGLLEEMLLDELKPFGEKGYNIKKKR
jgi:group I intron endonuclease